MKHDSFLHYLLPIFTDARNRPLHECDEQGGELLTLTINEAQKAAFLGNASALLFPIDWPEPFRLVMIEAMACGTPVIALRSGSVPEVIDHGVSGYIVDDLDKAVAAIDWLNQLDRTAVRHQFERRFSVGRMTRDYVRIYRSLGEHRGVPYSPVDVGATRQDERVDTWWDGRGAQPPLPSRRLVNHQHAEQLQ
jgi:glycosyltransferase involved in cell wall biosynthesis